MTKHVGRYLLKVSINTLLHTTYFVVIDLLQNTGQISKKFCEMHRLIEGDLIHILHLQYFSIFMKKNSISTIFSKF